MTVFEVYADNLLIHHSQSPSTDVKLLEPKLTLEVNAAGSFKCKVPPTNTGFDSINRLTTIIHVKKNGIEIWSGRIIDEKTDFWGNRSITCEGVLAFLNDTSQPPKEYHDMTVRGFLQALITVHNNKVTADKRFSIGTVTVTDPNDSLYRYTNYESTMEAIKEKMIDRLGGYLVVYKSNGINYIDYLNEPLNTNAQVIEFGKNLLDFSKSWDLSNFATVVLPQGERLEEHPIDSSTGEEIEALDAYLDVKSVNGGSPYVYNQSTVDTYGWIEVKVSWSDVTVPSNLLRKAQQYLTDIQFDNMVLELTAVDMSYMMNSDEQSINLFDRIYCKSAPHNMERYFPVMKMEIPIDNPSNTTFTLGDNTVKTSLSASLKKENDEIKKVIDEMPSTTSLINEIINEAYTNASDLLSKSTNGYVSIVTSETGGVHSEKLVISNTKNWETANKKWIFGINGLGYYTRVNGQDVLDPDGVAITMDGKINASVITTGTLNAGRIKAGILSDVNGNNYWNLETGEFSLMAGAKVGGKTISTIASEQSNSVLNTFVNGTYSTDKVNLQGQIDGKAETWYQSSMPSSSWTTTALKEKHVGDLWYNTSNNTSWIYVKDGSVYGWKEETIPDDVFDTIDGKAQIFTTTPTTPYDVGDLYFPSATSDILTCIRSRSSGSYVSSDWVKRNKYTDDTTANKALAEIENLDESLEHEEIFNRLTNYGQIQGIQTDYDSRGNLGYYINASYINSGTLSANFIKGGYLMSNDSPTNPSFHLNLNNGELTAKKLSISSTYFSLSESGVMSASGASFSGSISASSISSTSISGGYLVSINSTGTTIDLNNGIITTNKLAVNSTYLTISQTGKITSKGDVSTQYVEIDNGKLTLNDERTTISSYQYYNYISLESDALYFFAGQEKKTSSKTYESRIQLVGVNTLTARNKNLGIYTEGLYILSSTASGTDTSNRSAIYCGSVHSNGSISASGNISSGGGDLNIAGNISMNGDIGSVHTINGDGWNSLTINAQGENLNLWGVYGELNINGENGYSGWFTDVTGSGNGIRHRGGYCDMRWEKGILVEISPW